jgi:hypothetical protein
VRENQHLIDLPDLSTMAASVQVPEARIHQVRLGLKATASIEAQMEVMFRGTVSKIALLPDYVNRWLNPDLKTYLTEITIDEDQDIAFLRPGMTAKVEILVDQLTEAVFVPVQSITTIDGAPVCYILKEGQFVPRSVELGESNDSFVVVRAGLDEGDLVQLNAPRPQGMPPERKDKKKEKDNEKKAQEKEGGIPEGYVPTSYQEEEGGRPKRGEKKQKERRKRQGGKDEEYSGDGTTDASPSTAATPALPPKNAVSAP